MFPWLFTLWMSAFDWKIGSAAHFVGFDNYAELATNQRFLEAVVHTFYFTALAVVLPLVLGHDRRARSSTASSRCAACCARSSSCR